MLSHISIVRLKSVLLFLTVLKYFPTEALWLLHHCLWVMLYLWQLLPALEEWSLLFQTSRMQLVGEPEPCWSQRCRLSPPPLHSTERGRQGAQTQTASSACEWDTESWRPQINILNIPVRNIQPWCQVCSSGGWSWQNLTAAEEQRILNEHTVVLLNRKHLS